MNVTFREAVEADLGALIGLLADDMLGQSREVVSDPPLPAYVAAFAAVLDNPYDMMLVAETEDGRVVGCAQLTILNGISRQGARRGLIESVRIASDLRGSGVGERLVGELVARARAADCRLVQLTTDARRERAHAFYKRLGFEATHVGMKLEL